MTTTDKPKRNQRDFLEDWGPDTMQSGLLTRSPERELWTAVIGLAVTGAIKGNSDSWHWINANAFLQLSELLSLHRDTAMRIRDEVNKRYAAITARIEPKPERVTKPRKQRASAALRTAPVAGGAPWLPLSPSPASANAPIPVPGPLRVHPAPDVLQGWTTTLEPLDWVPFLSITRKARNAK
jgi:hypothetical protein